MGKNRKRKRPNQQALEDTKNTASNNDKKKIHQAYKNPTDDDVMSSSSVDDDEIEVAQISQDDLEITIGTLQLLNSSKPSVLAEKRFKPLRTALYPLLLHQIQSYQHGTDYRIKVTQFLAIQQWSDALAALRGCRDFGQIPKQGTIQRWVRDCDLCTVPCKLQLLNAILMLGNPTNTTTTTTLTRSGTSPVTSTMDRDDNDDDDNNNNNESTDRHINRHDPRRAILLALQKNGLVVDGQQNDHRDVPTSITSPDTPMAAIDPGLEIMADWSIGRPLMTNDHHKDETGTKEEVTDWDKLPTVHLKSRILYQEAASERTPPNRYDLLLHTTDVGSIQWSANPPTIVKHPVPFLESQRGDAFLLENVLTVEECQQLRAAATQLGWRPDHPTTLDEPTGIDSCEWLVDESIISVLSDRVRPYLPHSDADVTSGTRLLGSGTTRYHSINPRWRFFRYGPNCVYRPHIDGSWPASRVNANGQYECYSQDTDGSTIKSFHTFLIYLNDNFEGGQTRFYIPQTNGDDTNDCLVAHGVTPHCGSVLIFSQGNTASLLHEGSAVTQGHKFVIRTDVLYQTRPERTISPHHKANGRGF